MAQKVNFEGRTYTFEDDATPEEIAQALDQFTRPQPTSPSQTVPAKQERVKAPEKGANLGQQVANFFTGDNRAQKGVGEIAYQSIPEEEDQKFEGPLAPLANALPRPVRNFVGATQKAAIVGGGMFLDPNEESRAAIIKKNVPTSEFRRDEYGNLQVRYTPSTPWAYVNRPGASLEDAQSTANVITQGVTVAKVAPFLNPTTYTGLVTRSGVAALAGGGGVAAGQKAAESVGGKGVNAGDVAVAAAAGAGGQTVGDLAVLGYGAAREGVRAGAFKLSDWIDARLAKIAPPQPTGQVVIDPKSIGARLSSGARAVGTWLDDQARAAATRGNMGDYKLADEFGVPLTRGQAQRNAEQIAREQAFGRSGGSQEAREVMDSFKNEQGAALRAAGTKLATRGEEPLSDNAAQAGVRVAQGLEARRAALKEQADAAYAEAFSQAREVPVQPVRDAEGNAVNDLLNRVDDAIDADFLEVPSARKVIARVQELINEGKATFAQVERARQALNRLSQAAHDARDNSLAFGIDRVRQTLDDWVGETLPQAAPGTRGIFDESRTIFGEMRQLFSAQGPRDAGGKALEKVIETGDMTGKDIVNTILGSDIGARESALGAVRRIKTATTTTTQSGRIATRPGATAGAQGFKGKGPMPPELQALREAAVYRILSPLERVAGQSGEVVGELPVQQIRNNIKRALSDDAGGPIMRELFTPEEIARMQRFMQLTEQLIPPPGTVNYSNTTYAGARMIRDWFQKFVETTLGGGPGVAFSALWSAPRAAFEGAAARQAITRQAVSLPMNKMPAGAIGTAAYGTLQNQDDAYGP